MTKIFLIHGLEPNTDKEIEIKNKLVLVITCYLCRVIRALFVIVVLFTTEFSYSSSFALPFLSLIHSQSKINKLP